MTQLFSALAPSSHKAYISGVGDVYSPAADGPLAALLLSQFYLCPSASKLIQEVLKTIPLLVHVFDSQPNHYNTAYTVTFAEMKGNYIGIPSSYSEEERFSALIMEVLNTKDFYKTNSLRQKANEGEISREKYAVGIEKFEYGNQKKRFRIYDACRANWSVKARTNTLDKDFAEYWLGQLSRGHTDFIRREWHQNYRSAYCSKHPENKNSCNRPIEDFVDVNALEEGPEKEKILKNREIQYLRDELPQLPEKFRKAILEVFKRWRLEL